MATEGMYMLSSDSIDFNIDEGIRTKPEGYMNTLSDSGRVI